VRFVRGFGMPPLIANAESGDHRSSVPLFRPQALAAQQKLYGEILLIRPFSLFFLGWLATGVVAAVFGFLTLGHYTEKARVAGFLVSYQEASSSSDSQVKAIFYIPSGSERFVQPGEHIILECQGCPNTARPLAAKIMQVAAAKPASKGGDGLEGNVRYEVTMRLPTEVLTWFPKGVAVQAGMGLSAEIPVGRKPLVRWLFERPAK
jgi:hypothetical protein